MDENTGLLKTSMWRIGKDLKKELGAKIDELGSLDLEFEQEEAWSPEAEAPDRSTWCQNVDSILPLVWRVKERKH